MLEQKGGLHSECLQNIATSILITTRHGFSTPRRTFWHF